MLLAAGCSGDEASTGAIVYQSPEGLAVVNGDGTGNSRGSEKPWIALPAWTPDGERILVTLIHGLGHHTLATIEPDGGGLEEIVDPLTEEPVLGAHSRQSDEAMP